MSTALTPWNGRQRPRRKVLHRLRLQSTDAVKSRGRYNMQCSARLNAPRTTCLPCEILEEKPSLELVQKAKA